MSSAAADVGQFLAFALCSFIAIAGALGMATTMSMFRSGVFLMASFVGVAGLFILLSADLLGLLQIMMYVGGMLVMILFMVLVMHDPGGALMAAMPEMMTPVERLFSLGLTQKTPKGSEADGGGERKDTARDANRDTDHEHRHQHPSAAHGRHDHPQPRGEHHAQDHESGMAMHHGGEGGHAMGGMACMDDMSMVTPVRGLAAVLAAAVGAVFVALLLLRPAWPLLDARPDPRSAEAIGSLLMGKYMVGFEGAGFLILIGIVGAVLLARVERHPDPSGRDARVAVADAPPSIEPDPLTPLHAPLDDAPAPEGTSGADRPAPQGRRRDPHLRHRGAGHEGHGDHEGGTRHEHHGREGSS